MLLAADVGGTKTLVGLFRREPRRPSPVAVEAYRTLDYPDLATLAREFLRGAGVSADQLEGACVGVAGPIEEGRARLTNVPWIVDAAELAAMLPVPRCDLLNDLEALAWGVTVLRASELTVLWPGERDDRGSAALLAAGTGLGVALLPRIDGRFVPRPSEGGHASFAARNAEEQRLQTALIRERGRAEIEQVLSGPGLANIYRLVFPHECPAVTGADPEDLPSRISRSALEGRCDWCRRSLEMFVSAYGAVAGDLALTALATGGLFIGGGIAPQILDALRWPVFLDAFFAKAPLDQVMRRIPVGVILNPEAGLLGAATYASLAQAA